MKNARMIFRQNNKPHALSLAAAWLLLVIIPIVSFIYLFEHILSSGEQHLQELAKIDLITETEHFRQDVSARAFLKSSLKQATGPGQEPRISNMNADNIKEKLEKQLGFPVLAVFQQNQNNEVSIAFQPQYKKGLLVSRTMLKNLFQSLSLQFHENSSTDKQISSDQLEKIHGRGEAFLKSIFRIIGKMKLEPGEPQLALSGKPEMKKLFFFYQPIFDQNKVSQRLLLVVREVDIPMLKIMRFAARQPANAKIERSFALIKFADLADFNHMKQPISMFRENRDNIAFFSPFPVEMVNRIVYRNTYYPFALKKVLHNFPLLKTSIRSESFAHPLRRFLKPFRAFCKLAALLVSLVFLRFYFFGTELPLRIRTKILVAMIFASSLPFSALYLIAGYHEEFRRNFTQFEIVNLLNQQIEEFNIAINSYRSNLENQNAELSDKLNYMEDYEFITFLTHWMKKWPVSQIFTRIKRNNGFLANSPDEKIQEFEVELKDFLFTCVENSFKHKKSDGSDNDGQVGLFKIQIKGIGVILANFGLIHNTSFTNLNEFYTVLPVFPRNDRFADVDSIFMLKYNSRLILNDFFAGQSRFAKSEFKAGFKIQKCYIPINSQTDLPERETFIADPDFPKGKIVKLARKVLDSRAEETQISNFDGLLKVVHARYLHNLNCIVIMLAEQVTHDQFSILPGLPGITLYSIGILAVILVLMGKFFVEPVKLLQQSAEATANGDFDHQINLAEGDEFGRLSLAFNQMIKGLDEREKMASFVSENVLDETADASEMILEPGGERSNVSVLFCSLPDLKDYFAPEKAQILLTYLGRLIDTADAISRRHSGIIDKIIEGTVMIVFRQRDAGNSHVISACQAALEIAASFPHADCPLRTCAGIASGEAVSGKIGSKEGKLDYTVIGNPVNLAARLKAQAYLADQTGILLCPQTIRMLKGIGKLRFIERVEIKGRTRTFPMYELLALRRQ